MKTKTKRAQYNYYKEFLFYKSLKKKKINKLN